MFLYGWVNVRLRADITKPFRQSFALPPPLPAEVEAWVSARLKSGSLLFASAKQRGAGAILLRLKGILLDVRY